MDIKILELKDPKIKEKERLILSVTKDTDLGKYMIAESTVFSDGTISSKIRNTLWLADQPLKTGDQVVIYTKGGTTGKIDNPDGSTSYFYYWNLNAPLGEKEDSVFVVYETSWTYARVYPKSVKADEYEPEENK